MNLVAMQFHNISKRLDFKPDDNYVSHSVQYQLYCYGNWTPTRRGSPTPWTGGKLLCFCSL